MAEVGVLQLTIDDNSKKAAGGLSQLTGALTAVKTAVGNGLGLSTVNEDLKKFAQTITRQKSTLSVIKTLTSFGTAMDKLSKVTSAINFNTQPIKDLKKAIGDGIEIKGNIGQKLIDIRDALGGEWGDGTSIQTMQNLKKAADGFAKNDTAGTLTSVAKAMTAYAKAANMLLEVKDKAIGGKIAEVKDAAEKREQVLTPIVQEMMKEREETGRTGLMKLNMQFFAKPKRPALGSKAEETLAQIGKELPEINSLFGNVNEATQTFTDRTEKAEEQFKIIEEQTQTIKDSITEEKTGVESVNNALEKQVQIRERINAASAGSSGRDESAAKAATQTIKRLMDRLNNPVKNKMKFSEITDIVSGVSRASQTRGSARESAETLQSIKDVKEATEQAQQVQQSFNETIQGMDFSQVSGVIPIFDQIGGSVKYVVAETKEIFDTMQAATDRFTAIQSGAKSAEQSMVNLTEVPATGLNGPFANASDELSALTEQLNQAKASMEFWSDTYEKTKKRIKYNGPSEELTNMLKHAEEGFYAAMEAVERYQEAISTTQQHISDTITSMRNATEATDAQANSMLNAANAANEMGSAMSQAAAAQAEGMQNVAGAVQEANAAVSQETIAAQANLNRLAIESIFDALNNQPHVSGADITNHLLGIGEAAKSAEESMGAFMNAMAFEDSPIADNVRALNPELNSLAGEMSNVTEVINGSTLSSLVNLDGELKQKKTDTEQVKSAFAKLGDAFKAMFPTLSGLLKRFKSMIIMRSLRYIIRSVSKGFSEGVQNVYHYSKAVGTSLAPSMDQAATAMQQFKNSIGAAVAPLIQAFVPVLQTVVDWLITGINYLNQFFALMNGQQTWTRALPEAAEAFEDTKKNAKGAGEAIKDLLADWDELNIIQSENGGNGGGTSGRSNSEYAQMFEEVSEYSDEIKRIVDFIEDHFGGIWSLIKKIGLALLGWKISRAFNGVLGQLGRLVAGGALVAIGLELSYGSGFEAGKKGHFDSMDILGAVGGAVAAALGGSLITSALGLGGGIGFAVGLAAAVVVTLVGWIDGRSDALDAAKWGNISYTQDEINRLIKQQFTFPVDAEIDIMKAHIRDTDQATANVNKAISDFSLSLTDAERVVADIDTTDAEKKVNAVKQAAVDAQEAIKALQSLIDTNEKGLTYTLTNFKFTNEEGQDITEDLLESIKVSDTTLREYFTGIGKQLSDLILAGEKSGWKNGEDAAALELMESQKRIYDRAAELSAKMKFETNMKARLKNVVDRDTATSIYKEQEAELEEYEATVKQMVQDQADNLLYLAGLAESAAIEVGIDTDQGKELLEASNKYKEDAEQIIGNMQNAVDDKLKDTKEQMAAEWAEVLKVVYGEDYLRNAEHQTEDKVHSGLLFAEIGRWFGIESVSDNKKWIQKLIDEGGYEDAASKIYESLKEGFINQDPNGITKFFFDQLGGNLFDLLDEEGRQMIANNLKSLTSTSSEAYQLFKYMFGLDDETAEKYIDPMYQHIWDTVTEEPKRNFFSEMMKNMIDTADVSEAEKSIDYWWDRVQGKVEHEQNGLALSADIKPTVDFQDSVTEDIAEEINDELESAWESISYDGKIELNPDLELSNDAMAMLEMVTNAINSGKGMSEVESVVGQITDDVRNGNLSLDSYLEAVAHISEIIAVYKQFLKDGYESFGGEYESAQTGTPYTARIPAASGTYNAANGGMYGNAPGYNTLAKDVEDGTKAGNAESVSLLTLIKAGIDALNQKSWNVTLTPSAAFGLMNQRSANMAGNVTGDIP